MFYHSASAAYQKNFASITTLIASLVTSHPASHFQLSFQFHKKIKIKTQIFLPLFLHSHFLPSGLILRYYVLDLILSFMIVISYINHPYRFHCFLFYIPFSVSPNKLSRQRSAFCGTLIHSHSLILHLISSHNISFLILHSTVYYQ